MKDHIVGRLTSSKYTPKIKIPLKSSKNSDKRLKCSLIVKMPQKSQNHLCTKGENAQNAKNAHKR